LSREGLAADLKANIEGESQFESKYLKANADLKAKMLEQQHSGGFVFGFRDLLWVSVGQYFIFGALCPSKNRTNEQTYRETYRETASSLLPGATRSRKRGVIWS